MGLLALIAAPGSANSLPEETLSGPNGENSHLDPDVDVEAAP